MFITPCKIRARWQTVLASWEDRWGRLCPRYQGTAKLVPRPGRGSKKLFSKNEVLTRTHSRKSRQRHCSETEGCRKRRRGCHRTCSAGEWVLLKKCLLQEKGFSLEKVVRWGMCSPTVGVLMQRRQTRRSCSLVEAVLRRESLPAEDVRAERRCWYHRRCSEQEAVRTA